MRGSRRRLRSLAWSPSVPMTISPSSRPTQATLMRGDPSGSSVTTVATAAEARSSSAASDSRAVTASRYMRPPTRPTGIAAGGLDWAMPEINDAPQVHADERVVWRAWLEANHATAGGVWLVTARQRSGRVRARSRHLRRLPDARQHDRGRRRERRRARRGPRTCCRSRPVRTEKLLQRVSGTVWGVEATGYEIRHGRIDRDEPLLHYDDVLGTSWHGLLEGDAFRRKLLTLGRGAPRPRRGRPARRSFASRARGAARPARRLVRRARRRARAARPHPTWCSRKAAGDRLLRLLTTADTEILAAAHARAGARRRLPGGARGEPRR